MNCISDFQCKLLHSLILQIGDIRRSPYTSASLTLQAGEDRARGLKGDMERGSTQTVLIDWTDGHKLPAELQGCRQAWEGTEFS